MLTDQQLQDRLLYVTGSDAAVICGLSPYKTKVQLWLEKTRREVADDISGANHIKFGNYMEDGVAKWFEAESGKKLDSDPFKIPALIERLSARKQGYAAGMLVHPEHKWMAGNMDRFLVDENAILECKTAMRSDGWGDGENIIPTHYLMQVAHYCACGGFDRAYIAVVFTMTREMRYYQYDRNLELEAKLIKLESDFWHENVLKDVAPAAINEEDVLALYKEADSKPLIATHEAVDLVAALVKTKLAIKALEDTEQELKDEIALVMQDKDTLINQQGEVIATWKFTKPIKRFDAKGFEKKHKTLHDQFLKIADPQRRMVTKGKKDE